MCGKVVATQSKIFVREGNPGLISHADGNEISAMLLNPTCLRRLPRGCVVLAAVSYAFAAGLVGAPEERYRLEEAIAPVNLQGPPGELATVTRQQLTSGELAASQRVSFALRMRNFEELQARIARGEVLTVPELADRYFPARETWREVARWAAAQGFRVEPEDVTRMAVTVTGSVARLQAAMQMRFARVIGTDGGEFTSAITPPVLPASFRDSVVSVLDLQPHLRPLPQRVQSVRHLKARADAYSIILPQTIAQLYQAADLGLDGRGQTIAILGGANVNPDDLTTFWQTSGLPTTVAQYRQVDLPSGVTVLDNSRAGEETINIQWASAMAPGANIVYISTLSINSVCAWILAEFAAGRPIHQLSCSYAGPEASYHVAAVVAENQFFAAMAAVGVTIFYSSGNDGSTHTIENGAFVRRGYDPNGIASPFFPASSPYVTGVGGTTVAFTRGQDNSAILPVQEGAWTLSNATNEPSRSNMASTGGLSRYFERPAWQVAPGLAAGERRAVPDVAAVASSNFPYYAKFRELTSGADGTSLASPIWAGLCALINQALAEEKLPPVGLLGPKIYPLAGTPAFYQMTTGSANGYDGFSTEATNGAYKVGPGHTLITGLGSPNIEYLIAALIVAAKEAPPPPPAPAPTLPPPVSSLPQRPHAAGGGGAPSIWFLGALALLVWLRHRHPRPE